MKYILIGLIAGTCLVAQQPARMDTAQTAASLLAQTSVARQALANHDRAAAMGAVNRALSCANTLESSSTGVQPLLVPLSSEMESESTLAPAHKHHAGRLKKNADVAETTGHYTATTLNVTTAQTQLQAARAALDQGNLDAADADLAAVQGAVATRSHSGQLPLEQARENLVLARSRILAAHYKDAILPLKEAARALDQFANQNPRPAHAEHAEEMRVQIDALADQIGKNHADSLSRVTAWRDQVTGWFNSGMAQ